MGKSRCALAVRIFRLVGPRGAHLFYLPLQGRYPFSTTSTSRSLFNLQYMEFLKGSYLIYLACLLSAR